MKTPHICSPSHGKVLFSGEGFSRRRFLGIAGGGIAMSTFERAFGAPRVARTAGVPLKGTARNVVLIFLQGGPSHVDMWDFKEAVYTPMEFAPTNYGDLRFPQGLLPKTAENLGRLALVRSGLAWALVHPLAQTWSQIARNPSQPIGAIAPHIGSVASLELEPFRSSSDVLPTFLSLNSSWAHPGSLTGPGYLPARHAPFTITEPAGEGLPVLVHPEGARRFEERWGLVSRLDGTRRDGALGKRGEDMAGFYDQALAMASAPEISDLFRVPQDDRTRYGSTRFGDALAIARNVLEARRGTRFIQVTYGDWDHHRNIYSGADSLFTNCASFDPAFGALLSDLAERPGSGSRQTLLDETLVVVLGEFGRTVGPLNRNQGRDHFPRMSIVFSGGGVRGGRVLGKTDERGADLVDSGWGENRDIRPEDVAATIYSALGIDYTTVRHDDPLGRGFEYVPFAKDGVYRSIDELF